MSVLKKLKSLNLLLGEVSTTELALKLDAEGFTENQKAARAGGAIEGNARKELEEKSGHKVVSSSNFLGNELENNE